MSKNIFSVALCVLLLALSVPVEAQQAKKIARLGYLSTFAGPPPVLVTFKRRLGELGWVEGKQIEFEYRYAGGDPDKQDANEANAGESDSLKQRQSSV